MLSDYEFQSLVVLPSIRLNNLKQAIYNITGDSEDTQKIMIAIEQHLEVDAYRWGNACPECHERLQWLLGSRSNWFCPTHGHLYSTDPTELLISFKPSEPAVV